MKNEQLFCMEGGMGETSYANNSVFQKTIIRKMKPLLEESIRGICCNNTSLEFLTIADLGCSSGPNALTVMQSIVNVVVSTCRDLGLQIPEFNVYLNDLPHNDFNTIFKILPRFYSEIGENNDQISCFIAGMPGSFYARLFPRNLVNFMHSSTCLHWLSQAPRGLQIEEKALNKGCIYGRKQSPPEVLKAYREQFAKDFVMFLRCRSEEIVHNGRILLSFVVTHDDEACPLMELTSTALYKLASQGRIDKEKLDGFNLPYYRPKIQQVKQLIEAEGSLTLLNQETFPLSWVATMRAEQVENGTHKDCRVMVAKSITRSIRALVAPLLSSLFGEAIMDDLFSLVEGMVINNIVTGDEMEILILAVSLMRN